MRHAEPFTSLLNIEVAGVVETLYRPVTPLSQRYDCYEKRKKPTDEQMNGGGEYLNSLSTKPG
jgi:hypothetical protein